MKWNYTIEGVIQGLSATLDFVGRITSNAFEALFELFSG